MGDWREQRHVSLSDEDDTAACQTFLTNYIGRRHKLGFVNFVQKPLSDAINDAKSDKPLILYFHNENEKFSINFLSLIKDPEVMETFGKKFDVLAWDLNDRSIHYTMLTQIRANFSKVEDVCSKMLKMINGQEPGIFLITHAINFVEIPVLDDEISKKALLDLDKLATTIAKCNELSTVILEHVSNYPEQFQQEVCNAYSDKCEKILNFDDVQFIGSDPTKFQQLMSKKMASQKHLVFNNSATDCLKDAIAYIMHCTSNYDSAIALQGAINNIFKSICNEPKYTKDDSINLSIIFNSVHLKGENARITFPIFVIMKCEGGKNSCRQFIDHESRIYNTWKGYKTETKFPHCEMILPKDGQYKVDYNGKVILETHKRSIDWLSYIDSFAKTCHHTSIFYTIPYVTAGTLGYLAARNAYKIYDRAQHGQDISLTNPESRDAYLFMGSSTVGLAAHAANSTFMRGKVSTNTQKNLNNASRTVKAITATNQGISFVASKYTLTPDHLEKLGRELDELAKFAEGLCDILGWQMKCDLPYKPILELLSPWVCKENEAKHWVHLKQTVADKKIKLACKCGGYFYRTLKN